MDKKPANIVRVFAGREKDPSKKSDDFRTIVDVVEQYGAWQEATGYAASTIRQHRDSLRQFVRYLAAQEVTRLPEIDPPTVEAYQQHLQARGLQQTTIETRLYAVRGFFGWLEAEHRIFENPAAGLTFRRQPPSLPQVISVEAVNRLLAQPDVAAPDGLRDRAMLEVLYSAGVRRAELLGLQMDHIDSENQTCRVRGKGSKDRVVPVGAEAMRWINEYLERGRPALRAGRCRPTEQPILWLNRWGRAYSKQLLSRMVRGYGRQAGIAEPVTSHTLRRSCATHLLANGASPSAVAKLLGHARLSTLSRYLQVSIHDLKRTHEQSHPGQ